MKTVELEDSTGSKVLIDLLAVESSHIAAIGYAIPTCDLFVEYTDGAIYRTSRVDEDLHEAIMRAPSKGKALAVLKREPKEYPCVRVRDKEPRKLQIAGFEVPGKNG